MMINNQPLGRFVLMALAGFSLIAGLWAGLVRLGWILPVPNDQFPFIHGPVMVIGFLGTLIGLERAVALERFWPYGIPILTAFSVVAVLTRLSIQLSALLAMLASVLTAAVFVALYRQYSSGHFIVMGLSAVAWLVGNVLWFLSWPVFSLVPWWAAFLILMIPGERLELSRVRRPSATVRVFFHASLALKEAQCERQNP